DLDWTFRIVKQHTGLLRIQMDNQRPYILIIEDDIDILEGYKLELEDPDVYQIITAQTVRQARAILQENSFAVVLTDLKLRSAERGGLTILDEVKKKSPDTIVII